MHPNPIAKARFENQKAMYEEEDKKLKERWEKERAAEKSAARGKGSGDNENVFEKIGRDYAENAQAEQEIEDKRWEGFGDFFAKEGGTAGQRQAPGFNYGGRESEHSGRSRSDNMALAMGVEEELLDKIAAEAKEKKGKDIFTEGIESSVWSTSAGITGLADMFIGKPLQSLGWEDNFISEWNKYYQDKAEEKHQDVMDAAARTGKGKTAETAAILVEMLGEAGIDALLGMVTGGASAAAKLGSKGGKVLKYADDVGDLAKKEKTAKFILAKDIDSAKKYAKNELKLEKTSVFDEGINVDVANGINKAIFDIKNTFGNVTEKGYIKDVSVFRNVKNSYAKYSINDGSIYFGEYILDDDAINKMKEIAEINNKWGGWSSNNTFHSVYHELGHAVYREKCAMNSEISEKIVDLYSKKYYNIVGNNQWTKNINANSIKWISNAKKENFSYYGLRNENEFVAEAIAQYFCSDNPSDISKEVVKILLGE